MAAAPIVRLGGWLFRHRTWLPLPLAAAVLAVPAESVAPRAAVGGVLLVAVGELTRLWSVRQIGVVSRTRSERLGPLVSTGPFALVRNPLYLGNLAIWAGFALSANLPWLALLVVVLVGLEYHAIVRWEETLLQATHGDTYRAYASRVPRWFPSAAVAATAGPASAATASDARSPAFSWRETFFSERGTLLAIGFGYAVLGAKAYWLAP